MDKTYVHGYDPKENQRLQDQAATLAELFLSDTEYPPGSHVLEAGCGVGAKTVTLASKSPGAVITSVDISESSLAQAAEVVNKAGLANVIFRQADIFALPFEACSFDHIFVCFVLEHLASPVSALLELKKVLKPGGTITVIEGDHGSTFFHPDNAAARRVIDCLVQLQKNGGGDANIGRTLYPLLHDAGFASVNVSPRFVYADSSRPDMVEGFTKKTFTAMIEGVREAALSAGIIGEAEFDEGVRGLYRAAEPDGVFCYTFFKAVGNKI
jgi:ubiquinone/menaquinone biosynthesis C-methylase UbiE